jgi:GAF domain-containing protein
MNTTYFTPAGNREEKYKGILYQLDSLINQSDNPLSSLANLIAILKTTFEEFSWVGFYLYDRNRLYLGPFQGKLACTNIEIGKGVCGVSAERRTTIIVPDVDKFPGHIACDSLSKSEIVVPIIKDNYLVGVLDIDSYEYSTFDDLDKKYLEEIVDFIVWKIL